MMTKKIVKNGLNNKAKQYSLGMAIVLWIVTIVGYIAIALRRM